MAKSSSIDKNLRQKATKSGKFTFGELKQVYKRGEGAYLSSGSRPGVSMAAWAMGRVNSFLRGSRKHDLDIRRKALKRRSR